MGRGIARAKMATEKISLYDPMNDTMIELNLSVEDAARAHKDK